MEKNKKPGVMTKKRKIKNVKNKTAKKDGGGSLGIKFAATRLFNPGNVDRFLYKNSEFLEFIDFNSYKPLYENKRIGFKKTEAIGIMKTDDDDRYHIYRDEYIKKRKANEENLNVAKPDEEKDKNDTENDNDQNFNEADKGVEAMIKGMNDIKKLIVKTAKSVPHNTVDTFNRYTFIHLNDKPLVDIITNPQAEKKGYLYFYKEFEPLFRVLHIYKYQINRILFTPGGFINFMRISHLLKSIVLMINTDAELKKDFSEKIKWSLWALSIFSKKNKLAEAINKKTLNSATTEYKEVNVIKPAQMEKKWKFRKNKLE